MQLILRQKEEEVKKQLETQKRNADAMQTNLFMINEQLQEADKHLLSALRMTPAEHFLQVI